MCETSIVSCSTKVSGLGATPVKSANLTTWCLRVWLFAALLANACSAAEPGLGTPARQQEMDGYKLVWADEFNQEGPPDPNAWSFEKGFVRNSEFQWYQEENAFCRDGMLVIEGRRERIDNPRFQEGHKDWRRNREFANYTSSCIHTRGKRSWKYGRFVIRAKVDAQQGLWPAIWTLGSARYWPGCGEVDVMEYYQGRILANACWLGQNNSVMWDSEKIPVSNLGKGWANQFHVWQLDWDAKEMVISLDGKSLNSVDLTEAVNRDSEGTQPFQEPHYILLNLAIGGTQGGDPSGTKFPTQYLVDYVRVYQRLGE